MVDAHALPPEQFDLSPVLAEVLGQVCAHHGDYGVMVREHNPYLLLGPKDRQLPGLPQAIHWAWEQELPVYMRVGGGSVVLLDRTCISFAVAKPCRDLTTWEANFRQMAQPVIDGLSLLGFYSQFGRAHDSYCEGPFDLVDAEGRKVAGIAQAIRGGAALVSGMIMVHQDPLRTTQFIQEFYDRAGSGKRLRPEAVTAIDRVSGFSHICMEDVKKDL
jgi:lipoate-protein ligase A